MTGDADAIDWPRRYLRALEALAPQGAGLSDDEVEAVLDLAREVAHLTERRNAPLATFLAGRFVAARTAAGVPADVAWDEARDAARSSFPEAH